MNGLRARGLRRRGIKGIWQHTRRVPVRYSDVETRELIRTSLHTQDYGLALAKAAQIELLQDQEWELALHEAGGLKVRPAAGSLAASQLDAQLSQSQKLDPFQHRIKQIAELRGFSYLPAHEVAELPVGQICRRIEQIEKAPTAIPAVLGAEIRPGHDDLSNSAVDAETSSFSSASREEPNLTLGSWLETFEAHVAETLSHHSEQQKKAWKAPRVRAIRRFADVVGEDLPVQEIRRGHTLALRKWWQQHLKDRGLNPKTANSDFAFLSGMWRTLAKLEGWEQANPFSGLAFAEERKIRAAFSQSWIRDKLLRPHALDGLNNQAGDILRVMINTGARPSELVNLSTQHIHLEADIPFIEIRAEGRRLKTFYSKRDLPLVGCALEAMKRHREGFPKYRHKAPSWSHMVGKYLKEEGLVETPEHSPYGLRHSLSDRLQNAGCEDRTRKEIMGHKPEGIIYGAGSSLETKAKWLKLVGFG